MTIEKPLPPGQKEYPSFDRFGLGLFANRFPSQTDRVEFEVKGNVANPMLVGEELLALPRANQVSDFHCVTTWSVRQQAWSGFRFADFYHQIVETKLKPYNNSQFVVFRGQDGYSCSMQLEDLLADDVLLADSLNGEKLDIAHGAPLRLVAPAHYGYKSVKHIQSIEFYEDGRGFRFPRPYPNLMNHPRARVAFEERAKYLPLWLTRPLYRFLMPFARRKQAKKLQAYLKNNQ